MRISKLYLLVLTVISFSSELSFAMENPCDKDLNTSNKAIACVQYKVNNDGGLYNFVSKSGHLGDTNDCKDDINNYFSKDLKLFDDAVRGINVTNCELSNSNPNVYRCIGTTPGPACHKKSVSTNKVAALIDKFNKKFVSLYPTPS